MLGICNKNPVKPCIALNIIIFNILPIPNTFPNTYPRTFFIFKKPIPDKINNREVIRGDKIEYIDIEVSGISLEDSK